MIRDLRYLGFGVLVIGVMLSGFGVGPSSAFADEADQDRARAAMLRGEVTPLPKVLSMLEQHFEGDVIEVELEEEDGFGIGPTMIYEMKLLTPEGRVLKLKVDAKSLKILTVEGEHDNREKFKQ